MNGGHKRVGHNLLTKQQLICCSVLLTSLPSLALENARLFSFIQEIMCSFLPHFFKLVFCLFVCFSHERYKSYFLIVVYLSFGNGFSSLLGFLIYHYLMCRYAGDILPVSFQLLCI